MTAPGQMARRGGILDVFPSDADEPVRIEFFGDNVESLRRFDPGHAAQRRRRSKPSKRCRSPTSSRRARCLRRSPPCCASASRAGASCRPLEDALERGLPPEELVDLLPLVPGATVPPWQHLPRGSVVVLEPEAVRQEAETLFARAREDRERRGEGLLPEVGEALVPPEALASLPGRGASARGARGRDGRGTLHLASRPAPSYAGDLQPAGGRPACDARPSRSCSSATPAAPTACATSCARTASRSARGRASSRGWARSRAASSCPRPACACSPTATSSRRRCTSTPRGAAAALRTFLSDFRDLKVGDLVVHEDHGIGRFLGLETLELGGALARADGARLPGRRQAQGPGRGLRPRPEVPSSARPRGRRSTGSAAASWEKVKRA